MKKTFTPLMASPKHRQRLVAPSIHPSKASSSGSRRRAPQPPFLLARWRHGHSDEHGALLPQQAHSKSCNRKQELRSWLPMQQDIKGGAALFTSQQAGNPFPMLRLARGSQAPAWGSKYSGEPARGPPGEQQAMEGNNSCCTGRSLNPTGTQQLRHSLASSHGSVASEPKQGNIPQLRRAPKQISSGLTR